MTCPFLLHYFLHLAQCHLAVAAHPPVDVCIELEGETACDVTLISVVVDFSFLKVS